MPQLPDSGFDRIASFYDRLARLVYGDALEQAQLSLLPHLPPQGRVLVIGGGSGWVLEQLLRTGKQLDILYIDAAPRMVQLAQRRYNRFAEQHTCRVAFRVGTEQRLQPQEQFDAVLTPFLLDLFPPGRLERVMAALAGTLAPGGVWLFADFWPVQQPPPRWQKLLLQLMYAFFRVVSGVQAKQLPDFGRHFHALGFRETNTHSRFWGMVQSKVYIKANAAR